MSDEHKKLISTYEDLIDYGLLVWNKLDKDISIELDDKLAFNVKIEGPTWDNQFDQRSAAIVLDVYKSLQKIYSELHKKDKNIIPIKPETRLIAEAKSGSLDLLIFVGELFKSIFGEPWKMSPEQLKIVCTMIASILLGGYSINKFFNYIKHKNTLLHEEIMKDKEVNERLKLTEESNKQLIEILNSNKAILQEAQKPFFLLKNQMSVDDKVYIPSLPNPLNKAEVSTIYAIEEENIIEDERTLYIDNKFRVIERKNVSDNVATIVDIETNKRIPNVALDIDDDDRATLALHLDNRNEIDLQVVATIIGNKIKNAKIIGIGAPRENAVKLKDVL